MIHDSYGTHANKCDIFGSVLRGVFAEIFTVDLLADLRHQVITKHPRVDIKHPPAYGDMMIHEVIKSEYFFC